MSNVGFSVGGHLLWIWPMLMIAERTIDGLIYSADKEAIEEMDGELTKRIEDFMRAVDVEALRLAKKSGKHLLPQSIHSKFSVVSCRARAFACAACSYPDQLLFGL